MKAFRAPNKDTKRKNAVNCIPFSFITAVAPPRFFKGCTLVMEKSLKKTHQTIYN